MLEAQQMPVPRCLSVPVPHQDGEGFGTWWVLWLRLSRRCAGQEEVPWLTWRRTQCPTSVFVTRGAAGLPQSPPGVRVAEGRGGYGSAVTVSLFALPLP